MADPTVHLLATALRKAFSVMHLALSFEVLEAILGGFSNRTYPSYQRYDISHHFRHTKSIPFLKSTELRFICVVTTVILTVCMGPDNQLSRQGIAI